jgi:hypothetical protein
VKENNDTPIPDQRGFRIASCVSVCVRVFVVLVFLAVAIVPARCEDSSRASLALRKPPSSTTIDLAILSSQLHITITNPASSPAFPFPLRSHLHLSLLRFTRIARLGCYRTTDDGHCQENISGEERGVCSRDGDQSREILWLQPMRLRMVWGPALTRDDWT